MKIIAELNEYDHIERIAFYRDDDKKPILEMEGSFVRHVLNGSAGEFNSALVKLRRELLSDYQVWTKPSVQSA